jgi:hypothetical protein
MINKITVATQRFLEFDFLLSQTYNITDLFTCTHCSLYVACTPGFQNVDFTMVPSYSNAVANIGSGIQLPHCEWRLGAFRLQHNTNRIVEVVISVISGRSGVIARRSVDYRSAV